MVLTHLRRWIGGIQLSLTLSLGAITGRLFDRGYLYVSFEFASQLQLNLLSQLSSNDQ